MALFVCTPEGAVQPTRSSEAMTETQGAGDRWEGASQPLLIKYGCDGEGSGDLLGQMRVRRTSGPGHSRRGRRPTGWASTGLKVEPCAVLCLSTKAFLGEGPWLSLTVDLSFQIHPRRDHTPFPPFRELRLQWWVLHSPHPSLVFWSGQHGGEMHSLL